MTDVKLLALWTGWCDPCGEERPLALTEHGPRGLRAWLRGVGTEDRGLLLACQLCGIGQPVPASESDDRELAVPPLTDSVQTPELVAPRAPLVRAITTPSAVELPSPRPADVDRTLDLLAEGLDVLSVGAR